MASHSLSNVHPKAKIGANVVIEPFATIAKDVIIGDGTWVGPNAVIMDGARIGSNCRIFPGAVISGIPQDLKFKGEITTAEIGNNTTIRECVTINRGTAAKGKTTVGDNCLIMAYVHIAHDCEVGSNIVLVNNVGLAGEVKIDDWAILGGASVVHQFVHIGCHAFIAGASKVGKDVPPFVKAARDPLAYVGINSIGLRRRNYTSDKITEIQDIYRIIFQKGMNYSDACEHIETNMPASQERDEIVTFVRGSKRGIMKGYDAGDDEDHSVF
jgi:UDP-N-acetylglucosamine acyltransferase